MSNTPIVVPKGNAPDIHQEKLKITPEQMKVIMASTEGFQEPPIFPAPKIQSPKIEAVIGELPIMIITDKEMRSVILQLLHLSRKNANELLDQITALRVRLKQEGDGMIFALLTNMKREGYIDYEIDPETTAAIYFLREKGYAELFAHAFPRHKK